MSYPLNDGPTQLFYHTPSLRLRYNELMVFSLFKKSNNDPAQPVSDTPSNETMTFDSNGPAEFQIQDVFLIKDRGSVAAGKVISGTFRVGQKVTIVTPDGPIETTITGIEAFHKHLDFVAAGSIAGLVLDNVDRDAIKNGDVITAE